MYFSVSEICDDLELRFPRGSGCLETYIFQGFLLISQTEVGRDSMKKGFLMLILSYGPVVLVLKSIKSWFKLHFSELPESRDHNLQAASST